jgi:hypothetical protein
VTPGTTSRSNEFLERWQNGLYIMHLTLSQEHGGSIPSRSTSFIGV